MWYKLEEFEFRVYVLIVIWECFEGGEGKTFKNLGF